MGGRGIKTFITDSVLAWYYMIFDKQGIYSLLICCRGSLGQSGRHY
jgi:hypothetical protein